MHTALIGIGSNLGERQGNILQALQRLRTRVRIDAVSSFYETVPVGNVDGSEISQRGRPALDRSRSGCARVILSRRRNRDRAAPRASCCARHRHRLLVLRRSRRRSRPLRAAASVHRTASLQSDSSWPRSPRSSSIPFASRRSPSLPRAPRTTASYASSALCASTSIVRVKNPSTVSRSAVSA